jgi:hypothetical protein
MNYSFFQAELFYLSPEHFLPTIVNETEMISDWDNWSPVTSSRLKLIMDNNVMTSGNLKIKCVVSSFQLYHQSNEVSVETFGAKPKPKSVVQQLWHPDGSSSPSGDPSISVSDASPYSIRSFFLLMMPLLTIFYF